MQQWQKRLQKLTAWWETPVGETLLQLEKRFLNTYLQVLFGYQMVLLADEAFADLTFSSRLQNSIRLDPFLTSARQLPKNTDVIIVPHALAYMVEAEAWLRAFWETLEANGKLILTGFNFVSCLGLQRLLARRVVRDLPMAINSQRRLQMSLFAADFTLAKHYKFAAHCITTKTDASLLGVKPSYFGLFYCLVASKQLVTVKNFQTEWKSSPKVARQSLVNPYTIDKRRHEN